MTQIRNAFALAGVLAVSIFAGDPALPRKSNEFVLNLPNGKQEMLTNMCKNKVCLVEFLFTTCPHCQHTAGTFTTLQRDYGARGFQAIGVAFNEMSSMLVPDFIKNYNVQFPVAWANRDQVLGYLQFSAMERFVVPQVVMIDKKGMIRHQSPPLGDAKLQDEKNLRVLIEALLTETSAPAAKPAVVSKAAPPKAPAAKPAATAASVK